MPGRAYPRRDDAVTFEQFNGTLESAQTIANLTGHASCVDIEPNPLFRQGDKAALKEIHFSGGKVSRGDYVVKDVKGTVAVYPDHVFYEKFSKDGN